ncbi:MAG: leucine-rich repeat domain-containing protein [Promethearchaeota archaeon]
MIIPHDKIVALNLFRTEIVDFGVIAANFPDLTHLNIIDCDFRPISPEIVQLSNLRDLNLESNHIFTIPEYICKLSKLKVLHLSNNEITALPNNIGALTKLEGLFIDRNQITLLPPLPFHLRVAEADWSIGKPLGLLGWDPTVV